MTAEDCDCYDGGRTLAMSSLECSELVITWISCAEFGRLCQWKMKSDERKKKRLEACYFKQFSWKKFQLNFVSTVFCIQRADALLPENC
jgi:hypothetical protein